MLGGEQCDDPAYADLVKSISQTGDIPDDLKDTQQLLRMIAMGAGVEAVPTKRLRLLEFIASGSCIPAFPYELEFPEVFFPYGEVETRKGFDAVIGNGCRPETDTSVVRG